MSDDDIYRGERPGAIAYMAGNGVAANLLMLVIVALGLGSLAFLDRESWPALPFNTIEVSMAYPGANPEEVEDAIVVKIEDEVAGLDDVKTVRSVAAPGMASVRIEVKSGADIAQTVADVESAVRRIQTFPATAARPRIREMTSRQSVIRMILYGDTSERSLKELARAVKADLVALPEVSLVEVSGVRDYEISIEVPKLRLRALGLTLDDVAQAVRANSLDLSAGSIDTRESTVRVRTLGQRHVQQEFEDVILVAGADGARVRLGDVADVRDSFRDVDLIVRHRNQPAVFIEVYRAEGERVMDVATAVHGHVADVIEPGLPPGLAITFWNDDSQTYSERVGLLAKNGLLGLLLVLVALTLLLEVRLAFWVSVGIGTTFAGALAVMLLLDMAINTTSVFVFLLATGIVVDDAVVVAEQVHRERQRGLPGIVAAIRGTRRVKVPLCFAVLTSMAAFSPLMSVPGGIAELWRALPVIVIGMLAISLVESLFILPSHLSHLPAPGGRPANVADRVLADVQGAVNGALKRFADGPLDGALRFAVAQPPIILAGAVGALVVSVSLLPAGIVPVTFADVVRGDFVTATLEMPEGTTAERTHEVARELEAAGQRVIADISAQQAGDAPDLLAGVTVVVGQRPRIEGGGVVAQPTLNPQANIATVEFKLVSARVRDVTTTQVAQAWRDAVGVPPDARGVVFSGEVLDLGNPIEAVLSHPDPDRLAELAESVVAGLHGIEGVFDVRSDHAAGIPEVQLALRPEARSLGLTLESLARQTRSAFFGTEALRLQRNGEEVRVYVRLPEAERDAITDVERYAVRTPAGAEVPLLQVATVESGNSMPMVRRQDRQRVVTVSGDVHAAVVSANRANAILTGTILADLVESDPDLTYSLGGEQAVQAESMDGLYTAFALAMLMVFVLLAIPLRSYTKPFVVMSIIPFSLIGVIVGHWVLQVPFSATAIMAILGLSGVMVNDSLLMVDFIDRRLKEGAPPHEAVVDGAKARFRPILITSVTTFLGLTPLILEPSIQAQFFMPFAASLGVGMLVTTVVLMLVVPAISALQLGLLRRDAAPRWAAAS